jgi:hypothetical protein
VSVKSELSKKLSKSAVTPRMSYFYRKLGGHSVRCVHSIGLYSCTDINIVSCLLKASTVEPEKQPLLGNARTQLHVRCYNTAVIMERLRHTTIEVVLQTALSVTKFNRATPCHIP